MRDFQIGNHDRTCRGFPFTEGSIDRARGSCRGKGENRGHYRREKGGLANDVGPGRVRDFCYPGQCWGTLLRADPGGIASRGYCWV